MDSTAEDDGDLTMMDVPHNCVAFVTGGFASLLVASGAVLRFFCSMKFPLVCWRVFHFSQKCTFYLKKRSFSRVFSLAKRFMAKVPAGTSCGPARRRDAEAESSFSEGLCLSYQ